MNLFGVFFPIYKNENAITWLRQISYSFFLFLFIRPFSSSCPYNFDSNHALSVSIRFSLSALQSRLFLIYLIGRYELGFVYFRMALNTYEFRVRHESKFPVSSLYIL